MPERDAPHGSPSCAPLAPGRRPSPRGCTYSRVVWFGKPFNRHRPGAEEKGSDMHSRSTTIIGAGVAVAILGAVLVFAYARSLQGSAGAASPGATSGSNVSAYVAATAIATGTKGTALSTA